MTFLKLSCALLGASAILFAVETKTWQQTYMADFERGTLTGLSLSSDGQLSLAPAVKQLYDPSVTFLWAIAVDSKGNLFAGGGGLGGSRAGIFEVDAQGKTKKLADVDGMAIQAIAIDSQDRVYAATSPDGKVYRIDGSGKIETFYDPKAKYIWALAFSKSGDLFVATGDQGEIHRVTAAGSGSVFFKTQETHARSLAFDRNGNLIVGTDPSGLILRVSPSGEGFVLYQAPKREITSVAVAQDGTIYAAGTGNKQNISVPPAPAAPQPAPSQAQQPGGGGLTLTVSTRTSAPPPTLNTAAPVTGGSEIYRIQADGYPRRVWNNSQDIVYALAFDSQNRVLAGTGNHGTIYRLDSGHADSAFGYTRLVNLAPTQVTGFATGRDGRTFAVTGNIGAIFSIGPQVETQGTFESEVFDAGAFSYWGRVSSEGSGPVTFETRSGNLNRPQQDWSPWAKLNGGRSASPAARFVQYRATLTSSAHITEIDLAYQMKNVAPVVEVVEATPANYKFPAPTATGASSSNSLTLPQLGRNRSQSATAAPPVVDSGNSPSLAWAKGMIGARWLANDDNGDNLIFKIEIRGVNETEWKLLKDKLHDHYYSWDSTAFPDGKYVVRVTASDSPSNPPAESLASSLESDPFLIDNTPPDITGLRGTPSGNQVDLSFHAKDALSDISRAEYSVNGGDWIIVDPVTRLTDSKEEDYRVQVERTQGETTIAVRVSDEYENQCVAKIVVK
jgi:sugar lactone lactonase YvrE